MYIKTLVSFAVAICIAVSLGGCTKPNLNNNSVDNSIDINDEEHITNIHIVENGVTSLYEMGYSGDLSPKMLLKALSSYLECTISENKITRDESSISIDFKSYSSPFDQSDEQFSYKVLDSIRETLIQNFGTEMEIYFSIEGEDVLLKLPAKNITFPADLPYKGSDFYEADEV